MASTLRTLSLSRTAFRASGGRFLSTTRVVRNEAATTPNIGTAPAPKKPVGGFRGGIVGFLFGFSLASSFAAYQLLDEYKLASAALQASVEELKLSTEKVTSQVRRIEAVEKDLKALSESSALKEDITRLRAEVKKLYDGLHVEFLDLRTHVWGLLQLFSYIRGFLTSSFVNFFKMLSSKTLAFALFYFTVSSLAAPVRFIRREVPQEHSHEPFLTSVRASLNTNNPKNLGDPVFALLGNAAAAQGLGDTTDPDCLQQEVADQAFTNAKAAGDVDSQVGALIFRALERNSGSVGATSNACTSVQAVNPEIAAIQQHQDPASDNAASVNKAIALELAKQIAAVGGDPLDALKSGTFAPGQIGDPTAKGNTCDDQNDLNGCIFTQNLLVPDATEDEINAAVGGAATGNATAAGNAGNAGNNAGDGSAAGSDAGSGETCSTVTVTVTGAAAPAATTTAAAGGAAAGDAGAGGAAAAGDAGAGGAAAGGAAAGGAAAGGNLQTFTGALGGAAAPAVTAGGKGFIVEGSDQFLNSGAALLISLTTSVTVTDIQGPAWLSPLAGQTVSNVTGVVIGKSSNGFYISGKPVDDERVSNGLFIFSSSAAVRNKVNVGDEVSITGNVSEFRSSSSPNDLLQTEITSPTESNVVVLSTGNTVAPIILGRDRSPPTEFLSALDVGPDGWLSVPNNQSLVDTVNATLQPDLYGMDFWSSLEGQLVTVPSPVALDFQNSFGEFWVHGDWPVTGKNSRGGLSITISDDGIPDANPETVIIGEPLDGSRNPKVAVGTTLSDITGVIQYQFGFYYVLPLTAPTVLTSPDPTVPPTSILAIPAEGGCALRFGDYNVENMAPNSAHLPTVAKHIVDFLLTPDIVFLQEIQDNSGPTDDGVVSANLTLAALVKAIANISDVTYDFVDINPEDKKDGGQPGGNIRQAYLYQPEKLSLVPGSPAGEALDSVEVIDVNGKPALNFNPGRIDPSNAAWDDSRKPLVAQWQTAAGQTLFTINLHLVSKGGSSSTQGNARPPVNLPVDIRTQQVGLVANFAKTILSVDSEANILVAGDFNEFTQTRSVLASINEVMVEIDEAAGLPLVERYTYVFDQNTEQLDHAFISAAIANRRIAVEHVHVNNWSPSLDARVSDHDPTVGLVSLCEAPSYR
ncbi:hypothetical protein D9758_002525 [Tetrapyrgos nigripes]|uniref:Endonuclease/exonuclease/phosphatase domain-containing protein n=1 Tax=Tetrapyrgos nigripes TaxID=182062 RepID=A0A8H5GQR5_9AGAR|nr:hypothetical protein D9758_002525 [Tetrapyrgos nigripes]